MLGQYRARLILKWKYYLNVPLLLIIDIIDIAIIDHFPNSGLIRRGLLRHVSGQFRVFTAKTVKTGQNASQLGPTVGSTRQN